MKLKNKVLMATGLVWVLFLMLTYLGSQLFLRHSFLTLEQERADRDLARINNALDQYNYSLSTFTADWSHWNGIYDFMRGKNPHFVTDNVKMAAFLNSTINLFTYWNKAGKQVIGKAIDTKNQQYVQYPRGLDKYVYPGSPLLEHKGDLRGFILTAQGIMMIASSTITDGDQKSPPLGVSLFGRLLSPLILQKMADATRLNINLLLPNHIIKNPALTHAFKIVSNNPAGMIFYPINEKVLHGFTVIKDINNRPIGMLQLTSPRTIYLSGIKTIHYYLASFTALGILFSLLMLWLLRILIVQRLEHLDANVADVSKKNEFFRRVDERGNDEISSLAREINAMMVTIEASQLKLEHRIKERTNELQNTNIQLQQEIAERKSVEKDLIAHKEHLVRLVHYDSLTALPNRIFFNEMLTKTLSHAKRHKKKLAILFIDLDRFKTINDALGHPTGDLVLKEIAARFSTITRAGDVLARLNGDEFIILLNDIDHSKFASLIAEKILKICSQPLNIMVNEFVLTASIGISIFPEDGASLEYLLKNADMAMYRAKRTGGNIFQYYAKEMDLEAHKRIELETALRKALSKNEFVLYYQPKLNLANGTIVGVEALIRWESPLLGLISPAEFIPLAEETGLILPLGEWALREACRCNKAWQDQGYDPITVAVNLSAKQFRHQDIAQLVATVLADTQLNPTYLELEITETAVMEEVEVAITRLNEIKQMGVNIAIDDFGTGYTSISYLKQFPVNVLKIDQSFIKGIPANADDAAITTAVIALAHSLNIKVVAEGVETPEQLQYLADHDCDMVQGYYLSQPLPELKMASQLSKIAVALA